MPEKRLVAARMANGQIGVIEEDVPELCEGAVRVRVATSLVSPGTEVGSWRVLKGSYDNPGEESRSPRPFGYSNSGVVEAVGKGAEEFKEGDRVACIGGGYAQHTNWTVAPHHLCVKLPDNVSHAQGSFAMLSATALHALRRAEPEFGEYTCVVGLGIIGQCASQFFQLAGNYVIGWETIARRIELAREWGIHGAVNVLEEDETERTREFTSGKGLDTAVFAFGGDGNKAFTQIQKSMKLSPDTHRMGRVVVIGGSKFEYTSPTTNLDVRRSARTGSGYHDEKWEYGEPYPEVFMRWTTRTNLELCMRLISEGRLHVKNLITHTIPLEDAESGIREAIQNPDDMLGVIFEMSH